MSDGLTRLNRSRSLGTAVYHSYVEPVGISERVPGLTDLDDRFRRLVVDGRPFVAKRLPLKQAQAEQECAATALGLLQGATVPGMGALHVVVPDLVQLPDTTAALVSPWLGPTLSAATPMDRVVTPSADEMHSLLALLLERGVDAPGCVPRNMFLRATGLWLIDWEDAVFRSAPARPSALSLMKWDLGWGDLLGRDLRLRERFVALDARDEPPLDAFERTLQGWLPSGLAAEQVRSHGITLTLASELPLADELSSAPETSPAVAGHLSEDLLPTRIGVFHTVLTARVRSERGDRAYRRLLQGLPTLAPGLDGPAVAGLRTAWTAGLFAGAEEALASSENQTWMGGATLRELADEAERLSSVRGWQAALRRAQVAEQTLARVAALVTATLDLPDLDVLLRGSCAQGVLGLRSDIDFELSSPAYPRGHLAAEELVAEILDQFGFACEGSAARPRETDIRTPDGSATRDLHEWMELRRPGSGSHDPGWIAALVTVSPSHLATDPSQYERSQQYHDDRESDAAKQVWSEVRVAVARLVFRSGRWPRPPVRLDEQLRLLPELLGTVEAGELTALCRSAFDLRESSESEVNIAACSEAGDRLRALRDRLALPGPPPSRIRSHFQEEFPS